MIDKLILLNDSFLKNETNEELVIKHNVIKNILLDKNCFKKMNIKTAYSIFKDLNIDNKNYAALYNELTK